MKSIAADVFLNDVHLNKKNKNKKKRMDFIWKINGIDILVKLLCPVFGICGLKKLILVIFIGVIII